MNSFIDRKINVQDSIGEKLQQRRQEKNLQIKEIAKNLEIRPIYLIALEEDNFEALPAGLYGRNYLKKYAQYLDLDDKELLKIWGENNNPDKTNNPFSQKVVKKSKFIVFPKIVRNILIALAILICFLYLVFYFKKIAFAPSLQITQPKKNLMTDKNSITIIGETDKRAEVTINGELVLNNQDGNFSKTINLKEGLNNIIIKAKKKYSREQVVSRQILVEEK